MPKINQARLREYLKFKGNPAMALLQAIKQIEKDIETKFKELKLDLKEMVRDEVGKMEQKDPTNAGFIEKIVNKTVAQLVKDTKGDRGEKGDLGTTGAKGDKGDSIRGIQGIRGKTGDTGLKGDTGYGKDGRDGKDGKDGATPRKSMDYFTQKDIEQLISALSNITKQDLKEKWEELLKKLDKYQDTITMGGQAGKYFHRGGITLVANEIPTGLINNSNKVFILAYIPKTGSEMVYVNGVRMRSGAGNDYTISGRTLTMATAPPTGSNFIVDYQRI